MKALELMCPLPWRIAALKGKYYGTRILDADGHEVMKVWDTSVGDTSPSRREKAQFGNWTQQAWDECCMDCHYESAETLAAAEAIVGRVNAGAAK